MTNKFNMGDYVEVVAVDGDSLPIGTRGTIVEIDDDFGGWMYGLDVDNETFYTENMLKLAEIKKVYQTIVPPKVEHNGEVGEVVYSRPAVYEKPEFADTPKPQPKPDENDKPIQFMITYYVDRNRTTLTNEDDGYIIIDDDKKDFHAHNVFLSGFFEGLTYVGVRFEAKVEYVRG